MLSKNGKYLMTENKNKKLLTIGALVFVGITMIKMRFSRTTG